jgi:hypothetical protein
MLIDRSNYELWLIDWLDGNLSDADVRYLQGFLSENPDLKEEYEEISSVRLFPPSDTFLYKNSLKKTLANLPEKQFEDLCIGHLENDLSSAQENELREIIDNDRDRNSTFELIQKLRLSPAEGIYKQKNRLIRRPFVNKAIRFSLIGLSAAAIIIIILMTYFSTPKTLPVNSGQTAETFISDSSFQESVNSKAPDMIITGSKAIHVKKQINKSLAFLQNPAQNKTEDIIIRPLQSDSLKRITEPSPILPDKIGVAVVIDLKIEINNNSLAALNPAISIPQYDDGRSKLRRYIAKTFREKILKENTTKDSPLKAFEIAEAGVSGLNKLFGWEMELDKKNDENGIPKSVYFNSRILKFNAPVKKTEPLP